MICPKCGFEKVIKDGKHNEFQRYKCLSCKYRFDYGLYFENDYIIHFGVKIKNNNLKINRENYALIDKKVYNVPKNSFILNYYKNNKSERDKIFEDEECTIYTDEWCNNHRDKCLENFDMNVNYFSQLSTKKFNFSLNHLLKKYNHFIQIKDLNDCKNMIGIYIMVLDFYKQVYIGQSTKCIKSRIINHWNKKKEFDRLIFGKVQNSILSVDSFGALDTTRIYVMPVSITEIDEMEKRIINKMNKKYILNRTGGGIKGKNISAVIEIIANRIKRNLK